MSAHQEFINLMTHPVKFRLYLFSKIPSAYFSGLRIRSMDENHCTVTMPYKWFSQNPFRSTYFACLAMAGEMSTGALAMAHVYKRKPSVSMLIVKMEATYFKKANTLTSFTCHDGAQFKSHVEETVASGEPVMFTARTTGINPQGELIAEFLMTWSFKRKSF